MSDERSQTLEALWLEQASERQNFIASAAMMERCVESELPEMTDSGFAVRQNGFRAPAAFRKPFCRFKLNLVHLAACHLQVSRSSSNSRGGWATTCSICNNGRYLLESVLKVVRKSRGGSPNSPSPPLSPSPPRVRRSPPRPRFTRPPFKAGVRGFLPRKIF